MGCEFWSLWRAFWRRGICGGLERRRLRTVEPVPIGTALHQLNSVPPTGRVAGVGWSRLSISLSWAILRLEWVRKVDWCVQ